MNKCKNDSSKRDFSQIQFEVTEELVFSVLPAPAPFSSLKRNDHAGKEAAKRQSYDAY